jgi:hypothetical protein
MSIVIDKTTTIDEALASIRSEVERAMLLHPPLNSMHEAAAVLFEEVQEAWDEIRKRDRDPAAIRTELVQAGAMVVRAMVDLL